MDDYIIFLPDGRAFTDDNGSKAAIPGGWCYSFEPSPQGIHWFEWSGLSDKEQWVEHRPETAPIELRARVLLQCYER